MVIFFKKWKKYNKIQLTKNKMDLNNRKMTNHPPSRQESEKQVWFWIVENEFLHHCCPKYLWAGTTRMKRDKGAKKKYEPKVKLTQNNEALSVYELGPNSTYPGVAISVITGLINHRGMNLKFWWVEFKMIYHDSVTNKMLPTTMYSCSILLFPCASVGEDTRARVPHFL